MTTKSNLLTNNELEGEGFELCEFGDTCESCYQEVPEGELFWQKGDYWDYREGTYVCRSCATIRITGDKNEEYYN